MAMIVTDKCVRRFVLRMKKVHNILKGIRSKINIQKNKESNIMKFLVEERY